ncbi:MAG: nuclear transport factor 2 family protein [Caulobacteraceae bacterium]
MVIAGFRSHRLRVMAMALAVFAVASPAKAAAVQQPSMAMRLQILEDKEAIRSLMERFYEYEETGDRQSYANLFAKDGELVLRLGTTKGGPAGILASMSRRPVAANAPPPNPNRMRHLMSNAHIEVKGDTATAVSRFTLLVPAEDNRTTRVGGTGRYIDKLVRENGEWKFLKRVIARDIPLDTEGANPKVD